MGLQPSNRALVPGCNESRMIHPRAARVEEIDAIRLIERASAQRFLGLMDALAADEPTPAEVLRARIATRGLLVAPDDYDEPAGFVMFRPVEARLYVEQIDVLPAFERRGIGAGLLDAVGARALAGGLQGLSLSTFRDVPWNAPYYRRLGFVETPTLTLGLAAIRAEHVARGLDETARVFMLRDASTAET
jgi:GNAT superfamily N-acetyltransferase